MNPFKLLLPPRRVTCTILSGLLAGIRLRLSLRNEMQIFLGLYEQETYADIRRLLSHCLSAVDLGAAKGDLSIYFLRQLDIQRVVAVEPLTSEREQMAENLALNALDGDSRLSVHAGFVGQGEGPQWKSLAELTSNLPAPIFIKIDIDGPEAAVLSDSRELLSDRDCRLLIETHSHEAESLCISLLHNLGYTVKTISPAWWRFLVREHRPIPHNRWLAAWRGSLS